MLTRLVPRASLALRPLARAASSTPAATPPEKAPHPSAPAQTQSSSSSLSVQSPNYPKVWSTSQRAREDAYKEARFEQTALEFQPQPLSAMEMIAAEPIRLVHGRRAVCDGGQSRLLEYSLTQDSYN